MSFLKTRGTFCRMCALAVVRDMSASTLLLGWWSPFSLIATPLTLVANLVRWVQLRRMAQPHGGWRHPLDAGRPLLRRPAALTGMGVLAALAATVITVNATRGGDDPPRPSQLAAGQCVTNAASWPEQDLGLVNCQDADADAIAHAPDERGRCLFAEDTPQPIEASYDVDPAYRADGRHMCLSVFSGSNY
ncbi:hypothetical protein [Streptomyces sp. CC224B]|uniref:hypothetical protein n=1 Tax=Streptomyces sp. CC224B TaxID=3044571 RepID=UPI0024A82667|nr:hypothetical protein [Streptomyces sp. CC224B]